MITTKNYFDTVKGLKKSDLPLTLQSAWEFVQGVTEHGDNWDFYNQDPQIKETVDLYFKKLDNFLASKASPKRHTPKKGAVQKEKSAPKSKSKTTTSKSAEPRKLSEREKAFRNASKVERISDELKFIKRFVLLHGKPKTQNQIRLFINALQKAITEKRISKKSDYAKEIMEIQEALIRFYNAFGKRDAIHVEIGDETRAKYLALVGKEAEMPSVKMIKSFINLQGKVIENIRAKRLYNRIGRAVNLDKITSKDKYWDEIQTILSSLKTFVEKNPEQGKIMVSSKELNGLQGVLQGCACEDLAGIPTVPRNTIMNSTDIVNLKFDKLGFSGKWLKLMGDPSKGFTVMIFGRPKMGKSYLAVDFAGYLARHHGTVLYVAREEGIDDTLQQKLRDKNVAHPDLDVSDFLPQDLSLYDFVFLDSVNKLGLSPGDLERLKASNPSTSFVYIFQTTKQGNFRGANEFQHDVDVVIEVPEKGRAIQFGRFNQGGEINIFN